MIFRHLLPRLTHSQVSLGSSLCLLVVLLLTSCSSASMVVSPPTTATGPAPVTTPLAPPPQDCIVRHPPQQQHLDTLGANSNVQLVGGGPFWFYGSGPPTVLHLAQGSSQQWSELKFVVEVGWNYDQPVTLRLQNTKTEVLAWWTDGQIPPGASVQTLVLNPLTDTEDVGIVPGLPDVPHGSPELGWKEWGLFPLFSVAGCYTLEVNWLGGSWQSSFAVGN
jgi:hypothetical protein